MSNQVRSDIIDGIRIVQFTNPAERNPLSRSVVDQLHAIVAGCTGPLIFTGDDRVFASGADLREIAGLTPDTAPDFGRYGQELMKKVSELPFRTAAAINGFCFGGAFDLALSCDIRLAAPHARFAHPGAGLGIITGWGGTQRLPRLVGTAWALEMFFTAEPVDAARALQIGLVDEIVDDPLVRALVRFKELV
jgi:enoyl-CoA hydratase